MKKLLLLALALVTLVLTLTFIGCGDDREKIVIYTSAEEYRIEHMQKRLDEQFPQYKIVIEYKSSGDHANILKTSGKNAACDITHDLEYSYAQQIAALGYLADLSTMVDFSVYAEDAVQSKYYAPEIRNGGCIAINLDRLNALGLEKPTSYEDLLDPSYSGLVSMPNPASSGTGYMFLLSLVNAWGEEAAFDYFDKLAPNVLAFTSSGSGPVNALAMGEVVVALGMTPDAVAQIREGVNIEILFFEEGSPYSLYGQGIVAGKEQRECVKEVFAFLSTTLNRELCEKFYPEKIFKDTDYELEHFPKNINYSDMTVENAGQKKEDLLKKWNH